MKKLIALFLTLSCVLVLGGCNNTKQVEVSMYSFFGEHDYFAISNGTIALNDTENTYQIQLTLDEK